jgi:PST family polysaccharide transporter
MKDLNMRMASGAAWMIGARLADRMLGLVSTMILARLLVPADFGIVAMATAVMAFLDLFRTFGFDFALIQIQHAERQHYDTVWTINILFAAVIAIILALLAVPASAFFDAPPVRTAIFWLAAATFMSGFANVGVVNFRKHLEFGKEFQYAFLRKLIGFAVTVPLAFAVPDYRALVAGIVSMRVGEIVLSYTLQNYRPRLSLAARGEIFGFSRWLMANNFVNFFTQRSGDFILGRFGGSGALGLFNVSYEVANLPSTELIAPINRAVFPGYAKKAANAADLTKSFLDVMSVIILIVLPAGLGLAVTAELVVPVFLGSKWWAAVPLVAILSIRGVLAAVQTNAGYAFMAVGKPQLATFVLFAQLVALIPLLTLGAIRAGAKGAVWAYFVASLVTLPLSYFIVRRELRVGLADVITRIWRPCVGSAAMVAAVWAIGELAPAPDSPLAQLAHLLLRALTGCAVYCSLVFLLWRLSPTREGAEKFIIGRIRSGFRTAVGAVRRFARS